MANAFAVLFATIAQVLKTIASLFNQVDQGVGMLDSFVKDAAQSQRIRHEYDAEAYEETYSQQVFDRLATLRATTHAKRESNPVYAAHFNAVQAEITAAVKAKREARKKAEQQQ